ncbi:MAG: peroxiredoxin-like family protein [Fulvivirga sp.]|nr:peroxiredoxin-like family protein [Fulvivirga sp.]
MKIISSLAIMLFCSSLLYSQEELSANEREGLKVGDTVLNFTTIDADSNSISLSDLLSKGPLVVVFYRGHWCPICNRHLQEFEKHLDTINAAGAEVIAISPEKPERLNKTKEKTAATFSLLYDEDYKISEQFKLTFTPGKGTRKMYDTVLGADLENAHSNGSERLPIPATFIINSNGVIVWRHFDPNYKKRSSIDEILENIPSNEQN